jgi:hypothetical protein
MTAATITLVEIGPECRQDLLGHIERRQEQTA